MKKILAAALLTALVSPAFAAPTQYTIDPNHSQVRFQWSHFGFSNVQARFDTLSGTFTYDPDNVAGSSVEVTIDVNSVDSGVDDLDEHLKGGDFFDTAKFGTATFKSTKVSEEAEGKLNVEGDLTFHGVTKPVTLDVTVNKIGAHPMSKKPSAGFDATASLKRSDFGVGQYVPNVSDEIQVSITVEATDSAVAKKAE